MIHILIINLLIEKPFYLLRRQSFSFQIVSEFCNFMGPLTSLFCPGGGFLYTMIVPWGGFLSLSSRVPGEMVLDEIYSCIKRTRMRNHRAIGNSSALKGHTPLFMKFLTP